MSFTLDDFGSAQRDELGAVMRVRHPGSGVPLITPDGTPITITLAGPNSDRHQKAQDARTNLRIKARGARFSPVTAREIREDLIAVHATCTLAWTGVVLQGVALDCSPANARRAYMELPWLRDQVEEFRDNPNNFMQPESAPDDQSDAESAASAEPGQKPRRARPTVLEGGKA